MSLVAGYAAPLETSHVEVTWPGELVGFDCFHIGRLAGYTGRVRQYTSIDLASSHDWAELATSPLNRVRRRRARCSDVAANLRSRGWRLERVLTDNGSEFQSGEFGATIQPLGASHTFIRAGRPSDNRRRRAGPADDPRRVPAAVLRSEPGVETDQPRSRPGGRESAFQSSVIQTTYESSASR